MSLSGSIEELRPFHGDYELVPRDGQRLGLSRRYKRLPAPEIRARLLTGLPLSEKPQRDYWSAGQALCPGLARMIDEATNPPSSIRTVASTVYA